MPEVKNTQKFMVYFRQYTNIVFFLSVSVSFYFFIFLDFRHFAFPISDVLLVFCVPFQTTDEDPSGLKCIERLLH